MKDNIITIEALHFWSDWTTIEKHAVDIDSIIGFIIHWRGDGWHIEVKTKEKIREYEYKTYEIDHGVYPKQVAELIANEKCKILSFVNFHNSSNFIENINKVLEWAKTLKINKL